MEKILESKSFDLKALDVDKATRRVKIGIAALETPDRGGEVFSLKAFDKTIAERGPKGTNEIWHMADHSGSTDGNLKGYTLQKALSKFSELSREGQHVNGVSEYRDTFLWREVVWPMYEAGDINQHSTSFISVGRKHRSGSTKIIPEVILFEGSAVLWGAHPNTPTHAVLKSLISDKAECAEDRIEWIIDAIKEGKYAGENESLLILELKQLETLYSIQAPSLQDTPPEQPEEKPLIRIEQKDLLLLNIITKSYNGI